ncbi:hypothetical protein PV327_006874 [Microctonus hyperodae]|uniref:Uncharacterized protein n=1 Tax=Microctonus hyperodae TaxID=165561 RepID=A0AA39KJ13_MICHY|nr:hypothetical protein PV327_006874 [Microctonus hyperodae]
MITLVLGGRDDPHHSFTARDVTALNSFSHHYQLTKWRVSRPKLDLFYYLSTLKMYIRHWNAASAMIINM